MKHQTKLSSDNTTFTRNKSVHSVILSTSLQVILKMDLKQITEKNRPFLSANVEKPKYTEAAQNDLSCVLVSLTNHSKSKNDIKDAMQALAIMLIVFPDAMHDILTNNGLSIIAQTCRGALVLYYPLSFFFICVCLYP